MISGLAAASDAHREVSGQDHCAAGARAAGPEFEAEVAARLGLLPSVFRAEGAPETARSLWAYAEAAYLDNPLPPVFKERLSIHLSRFCRWRYCLARHIGFLLGNGNSADGSTAPHHTASQLAALLRRPARLQGADLEAALSRFTATSGIPEPESQAEADFLAAATEIFLEPDRAEVAWEALFSVFGQSNLDYLMAILAFIRTAHYVSSARQSPLDEDVEALLRDEKELACLIADQRIEPQPEGGDVVRRLHDEIAQLREESRERLTAALKGGKLGIYDYDPRSRRGTWDETTRRLWGAAADEPLTYKAFTAGVHPDDLPAVEEALNAAYDPQGEGAYTSEYRIINRQTGETRWVRAEGDTTFEDGIAVRLVGTVVDVTPQKTVEVRLRESEQRLKRLLDQLFAWVAVLTPEGTVVHANRAPLETAGHTLDDVLGKPFDQLASWSWNKDIQMQLRQAMRRAARGESVRYDVPQRMAGGRLIMIDFQIAPMRDDEGRIVGLIASAIDIDDRVAAEDALAESEARFRKMADDAPVIIWVSEGNGTCTYVNKRWPELTGQSAEEWFGVGWLDAVHPDDREQTQKAFFAANDKHAPFRIDYRLRRKDGVYRWAVVAAQPRFGANQQFLGYIGSVLDITERKEIELALREREERLAAVLRAADLGSWHWNIQADKVDINRRYAEMIGYDLSEIQITYPAFASLVHPEDVPRVETALRDHFEGKTDLYSVEIRLRHKQGQWVWILASGRLIERDSAGQPLIMTGVHQDISGRVAAVQALRESEERFRQMANAAPVLIWMSGIDKQCTWFNRPWLDFVGRPMEQELGSGWTENVYADDLERVLETYGSAFDAREPFSLEYRLRRHDGEYRWLLDKGIPRFGASGEFTGYIGICFDITENKQAELAVRRSEEQFRLLADNMSQFAWMADATGWVYWFNKRWFDYTGTTLEEMQGWGWRKVHHPDHIERVVKSFSECVVNGEPWEDTFPLQAKDGSYRWFLSRALPVHDVQGRIVRWFGTNTDITERLCAEEHRELLINELNHRVKNTLAIVQSIARQTFRGNCSPHSDLMKDFQNRLAALAAAHNLLTDAKWEWTSLKELTLESVHSACTKRERFYIDGPPVVLTPKQAITFALALHELCTNATKYGALSVNSGRVYVTWTVSNGETARRLKLVWHECGGPRVKPPTRRGFGLTMIEQALAGELEGTATMDFRPEGLVCTIEGILEQHGSGI